MAFASLTIDLNARLAKFETDLGKAAQVSQRHADQMQRAFSKVGSTLATLGVGISFAALVAPVKSAIELGDQLEKLSQKVGISVQSLSELRHAAELSGVSTEQFSKGMKGLNLAIVEANDKSSKMAAIFDALGVNVKQGPLSALMQLADAVKGLGNSELKTALATQLMQKTGMDLIPMLNQGSEGLNKAADAAHGLGIVMGPDFTRRSEQFNDNMTTLTKGAEAFGVKIASFVLPGLVTFTDQVARSAEGGDKLIGFFKESVRWAAALGATLNLISEQSMDRLFKNTPALGVPVKGLIRGPDGEPIGGAASAPATDPAALGCVLSGGKWVGGKCVRKTAGKARADLVGTQWAEAQEEWNKVMAEASQLTDDFYRRQREGEKALEDTRMKTWLEWIDREREREEIQMRFAAGFDEDGRVLESVKKISEAAMQMASTLSQGLEDAIVNFRNLGDVARQTEQYLFRLGTRLLVTGPFEKFLGEQITKAGGAGGIFESIGSWFASVIPKFDVGTPFVPRDMVAVVHRGERIVPAAENRSGGGTTVNVSMTVVTQDASSFGASRGQIMRQVGSETRRALMRNS